MHQPQLLEVPEWAIQVFEKRNGLRVAMHDLSATWAPFLRPERFRHSAPCCVAVKARRDWACVDFEITRLREELPSSPEGRYHRCHAGILEWVVPVFNQGTLAWVLFAGQGKAAGDYRHLARDIRSTRVGAEQMKGLRVVDETEAAAILETLRQLRARLTGWLGQVSALLKNTGASTAGGMAGTADRRQLILSFLHDNHAQEASLRDLAKALHLGESRTSHLVSELFGCSYVRLRKEHRLRAAASLLRETALTVTEVGLSSGFQDVSHFHRSFQKRFGSTPLKYRNMSHA